MERFIAVDWGTTNRRAWLIDRSTGVVAGYADNRGLMSVTTGGFALAAEELRAKLGDWPLLLAGMVGSDKGWKTVPYAPCPADVSALANGIYWLPDQTAGIIPGVCQRGDSADVMRGEEVQALGALALGAIEPDGLTCHPGTHTKWLRLRAARISEFTTMMTGELFGLLRNSSVLSSQMQDEPAANPSFDEGVDESMSGAPLLSALFRIRAEHVLMQPGLAGASYASGLLIGSDVRTGVDGFNAGETISVIGQRDLSELYARAIGKAGFTPKIVGDGEAFVAGMQAIVEHIAIFGRAKS